MRGRVVSSGEGGRGKSTRRKGHCISAIGCEGCLRMSSSDSFTASRNLRRMGAACGLWLELGRRLLQHQACLRGIPRLDELDVLLLKPGFDLCGDGSR